MASNSSSTQLKTWDAFISFRGKDIRYGLLSHLSKALEQKQINTFIDDKLRKGEQISQALLEIIEDSYVSVVVFSENYADSPWCLDELEKILDCLEESGQVVLPVFYKVNPTDVQELRGSFGKAFHNLKETCQDKHKVDRWSEALDKISNLSGWDSRNIKSEFELVEEIVKSVIEKLMNQMPPATDSYNDGLIGINWRVKEVESLLQIGLAYDNQIIVGIWGMGGIGKSTIADAISKLIKTKFDSYLFMNFTAEIKDQTVFMLRDKMISQLLKGLDINTLDLTSFIRSRLRRKKVVIVIDDVNEPFHLKLLLEECDFLFNKESRIIVTSRDRQVLENVCLPGNIYDVQGLNDQEALQLFSLKAFKQNHPTEGYLDLSKETIRYAQGNPLALTVLGSNLCNRDPEEWRSGLKKLKNIPDVRIQEVLKKSYDPLDRNEKSIFLDIACFFKWMNKDEIERILESCGFFPKIGMRRLNDKSLISISKNGLVDMHDLLRQMGKDIVYEECNQPEGRSRLWNTKDICDVLTKDKGTNKVEGVVLYMYEINEQIVVNSTAFKKMCNLRFLKIQGYVWKEVKLLLPYGLEYLPEELRYLQWDYYPLESLPLKFRPNILVELRMPWSQLKQLWNGDVSLANLKVMDFSYSPHLSRIPELSGALILEVLNLSMCKSLVEISSFLQLSKLTEINLEGCTNLCSLPSCLHLENLEELNLGGCSKLRKCPEIPCNVKRLILDETAIEELPLSVEHCSQLIKLSLRECERLVILPQGVCSLKFLKFLELKGCSNLKALPENLGDLESSLELDISRSGIEVLPSSINQLTKLEYLDCSGCDSLTMLPPLIGLSCLRELNLGDCDILEIPESIKQLPNLIKLALTNCMRLRCLPELPCLESLEASNCFSLKSVSASFLSSPKCQSEHQPHSFVELIFLNCINLDSKVIMGNVFMESYMEKKKTVYLCIPGVEAPKGMRYQNKNGSIISNIRLDGRRIMGLSFCSVIDPKCFNGKLFTDFTIKCIVNFKDKSGRSFRTDLHFPYSDGVFSRTDILSQHVFLWNKKNPFYGKHLTNASFRFYTSLYYSYNEEEIDNKAVMKCGFHPIYEDDEDLSLKKQEKCDLDLSLSLCSTWY